MVKLELYGLGALLLALAFGFAYHKGVVQGREDVQVKFDAFVAKTEALGEKARADAIQKEKDNAQAIADANTSRNAALASLRAAQAAADARSRSVPITPAVAAGSSQICFEPVAFAAAIERYRQRVAGVVAEGDAANIDARALIQAWPK